MNRFQTKTHLLISPSDCSELPWYLMSGSELLDSRRHDRLVLGILLDETPYTILLLIRKRSMLIRKRSKGPYR